MLLSSDTNTSPGEKEDIELLERALEKALQVRTVSGVSDKDPKRNKQPGPIKEPGATSVLFKDVIQSSAPCKGSQTTVRSTSKSTSLDRKFHKKLTLGSKSSGSYNPGRSKTINNRKKIQNHPVSSVRVVHHQADGKSQQASSAYASLAHISTLHSKDSTVRSNNDDDLNKDATISSPSNKRGPYSHTNESGAHSLFQQNGYVFKQLEYENKCNYDFVTVGRSECV